MSNHLKWEVFVSGQIPVVTNDLPPGATEMKWSPISSTLISGERDAVLVDTPITVDQNLKLVDWIVRGGKNLMAIYATHGHGDHFFGVNTIQKRFPKARFVATREAIEGMRKRASAPVMRAYWAARLPALSEPDADGRKECVAALDTIESLKPVAAIAGHKRPDAPDTPNNIEATRQYIRDFDRVASHTKTALELYNEMIAIYPERVNPAVLWYSAQAVQPGH